LRRCNLRIREELIADSHLELWGVAAFKIEDAEKSGLKAK
jgi:hypothetical protein